jgi:hypothetical protein
MTSKSSSSCFGSALLLILALVIVRYALPGIWKIIAALFSTAFVAGIILVAIGLGFLGYFTYKNLKQNQQKAQVKQYERIDRTEALYRSVIERLHTESALNLVSAEELLQSEILITDSLKSVKMDLIRLKDFASVKNAKQLQERIRDYKQELRESSDPSVKQVIEENLKILNEKNQQMMEAAEEIRQKEASVDLIYNSLTRVEDDLKFGRPISKIFPSELYGRFGVAAPAEPPRLRPLTEKSSTDS